MKLNLTKSFILFPKSPFHFDGTFHKPSHFPNNLKLEDWEPGIYWQSLRIGKRLFGLKIKNGGTTAKPKLLASVFYKGSLSHNELEGIKKEISWRFELDQDFRAFNALAKNDKRFYPVFKKWMGMRNLSQYTLYELLIIAVVLQNATVRRSQQMLDALISKYGIKIEFDKKVFYAIWLPEDLSKTKEQELRDLRIGYRAKFIKRLSGDFANKKIDEFQLRTLDKENAKKELIKLYGIGPESARILLFEALHHYDVFDHIAPWQHKIYSMLFYNKKLVPTNTIQKDILRQYGDYSMLTVHYIWEDIFWRRKHEKIDWLEKEIRL
ncbi:MAG: hypothetical protein M1484_02725 [Patescibacteria group bacterium]|nr:hypothetical protein [Patescibacteria group bacterium]MCL5431995.1 hypothetical protein [Patescibacteria group bacterium]